MTIARLIWKEWRDHRTLIIAWAVLGPVALWLLQVVLLDTGDPLVGDVILPGMAGLFAAMIAAEVFCSDFSSGTSDFLARLPVEKRTLWLTKVSFVLVCAVLYFAWALGVEAARMTAFDVEANEMWSGMRYRNIVRALAVPYLVGGVATAAVILFSSLLRRGFAAVLAGLLMIFGFLAVLYRYNPGRGLLWDLWGADLVTFTLFCALMLGAYVSYSPWQRSRDLRRAGFAALGFGVIAMPAFAAAAADYHERAGLTPDHAVRIQWFTPSPDGKYLGVQVYRDAPWRTESDARHVRTMWLIDLESKEVRIPESGAELGMSIFGRGVVNSCWSTNGEILSRVGWSKSSWHWMDPNDATVTRPFDDEGSRERSIQRRWLSVHRDASDSYILSRAGDEETIEVKSLKRPRPGFSEGVFLIVDESGDLVRCEWDGSRRVLRPASEGWDGGRLYASFDRSAVFLRKGSEMHALDSETGETLVGLDSWELQGVLESYPTYGASIAILQIRGMNRFALLDKGGVRKVSLPGDLIRVLQVLPGGGFIVLRGDDGIQRLERLDEEGAVIDVYFDDAR